MSQLGALCIGMNTSDINNSGRIEAFTIAGEASALGIRDVTAMPRLQNVAVPNSSTMNSAGRLFLGTRTSNINSPTIMMMIISVADIRVL